jgi:carboxylesterase type B
VNDTRFTLPIEYVSESLTRDSHGPVYKYLIDQPNPWQSSSRAHHAVDLLFLFGNFDFSKENPSAETVSIEMRKRWIGFINGSQPWNPQRRFAYGPFGACHEIDEEEYAARRRVSQMRVVREAGIGVYIPIVFALTAGRISLLN